MLEIRKAEPADAAVLQELYMEHLTGSPPAEPQSMEKWQSLLERLCANENYYLLVGEEGGRVVSSVTLVVIENLTHNLRPYSVIENVVTHAGFRGRGFASALMDEAARIAAERGCYKIMLLTGSKRESTLKFYENCGYNLKDKTAFIRWL